MVKIALKNAIDTLKSDSISLKSKTAPQNSLFKKFFKKKKLFKKKQSRNLYIPVLNNLIIHSTSIYKVPNSE